VHVPPVVARNFVKVYRFCCVEFLCISFSRIFSMCFWLLGALLLGPAGGLPSPDPLLSPRSKFLATPLACIETLSARHIKLFLHTLCVISDTAKHVSVSFYRNSICHGLWYSP